MRSSRHFFVFCLLFSTLSLTLTAADNYRDPKPIPNANNDLDVVYLPQREVGAWQDRWVKLNVSWPKTDSNEQQRLPCILFVHGGGYGAGDKDSSFCKDAMNRAVEQGFVAANLNYILGKNLFPQVFYDYKAAVRFLRANADKYNIDPNRIGTWGFSAGGWLSSSSTFCEAGDLYLEGQKHAISESWEEDHPERVRLTRILKSGGKDQIPDFAIQMDNVNVPYEKFSSRIQALQADFAQYESNITASAPDICTYIGIGGKSRLEDPAKASGVGYFPLVLDHPKKNFKGARSVHVPPLEMKVASVDGKSEMELQDRVLAWFKEKLVEHPVSPIPEFRPIRRVFDKQTTITAIVPDENAKVYYTTDGTEPTKNSPQLKGPLEIKENTIIKAISVVNDMKPSRVATARFTQGKVPPTIVDVKKLPAATVGKPYKFQFKVNEDSPVKWKLTAQFHPGNTIRYKGDFSEFSGLTFNSETGELSGTPKMADAYTLLIQAGWEYGELADTRTYVLNVSPE